MATRKRYVAVEQSPVKDAPATAATPQVAAEPPPPVAEPTPPDPLEIKSSVEEATKNALRARLQEVQRADDLQREFVRQQTRMAAEPQQPVDPIEQAIANLPERMKRWYRTHLELATDPERAAQVQYCHHVARRETGEEFTEPYYNRMESMLFPSRAQPGNGHAQSGPTENKQPMNAPTPPRNAEPVRQQQYAAGAPVSAPPSREIPLLSTGRSRSARAPLTADELEVARQCGQTPEQYAHTKEMLQSKGLIGAGARDGR